MHGNSGEDYFRTAVGGRGRTGVCHTGGAGFWISPQQQTVGTTNHSLFRTFRRGAVRRPPIGVGGELVLLRRTFLGTAREDGNPGGQVKIGVHARLRGRLLNKVERDGIEEASTERALCTVSWEPVS